MIKPLKEVAKLSQKPKSAPQTQPSDRNDDVTQLKPHHLGELRDSAISDDIIRANFASVSSVTRYWNG